LKKINVARYVFSLLFLFAGIMHFVNPDPFVKIVPPLLLYPSMVVYISGFFEILGGIGILIPRFRRAAAWGLIVLLVSVFPANIYMATNQIQIAEVPLQPWLLWARLPLQGVLIWWGWYCGARKPRASIV
jgi:uncharacterized membrane protein